MYTALYRSERPETFDEVVGQEHIVRILRNQVKKDTVSHAYLFTGTRGTGKTSLARILAKAVNCLSDGERPCGVCSNCLAVQKGTFVDMIEIDAASNNGVDNVRELRESVNYPPVAGRRKVYIIDEVHMLSKSASNALLKTLEEPPENVMFILATTDPETLPATILSRCLRLDFHRIPQERMQMHFMEICKRRGIHVTEEALSLLTAASDGSMRDGLSILEQCIAGSDGDLDRDAVLAYLGSVPTDFFLDLSKAVRAGRLNEAFLHLDAIIREGKDPRQVLKDWLAYYRALLVAKYVDKPWDMLNMSMENARLLKEESAHTDIRTLDKAIRIVAQAASDARYSTQSRILLELAMVNLAEDAAHPETNEPASAQENKNGEELPLWAEEAPGFLRMENAEESPVPAQKENALPAREEGAQDASMTDDPVKIWERMWDIIREAPASLQMLRDNAHILSITKDTFVVSVQGDLFKNMLENSRKQIETAVSKVTGRDMSMRFSSGDGEAPEKTQDKAPDTDSMARKVEELFHRKPTIE